MSNKPYNVPAAVTAEDGEVMVDGPDGLVISFTPDAAAKSAAALAAAAVMADRQKATAQPQR